MTPFEREERKRHAAAKLAALRERARRLRHRVLAAAAIGFVVLWAAIFVQMVTGHDPALGPATATVPSAAQESVASDPERRALTTATREQDDEGGQAWSEAARFEEEQLEAEATAEAEAAELETAEAAELEAATTGQS